MAKLQGQDEGRERGRGRESERPDAIPRPGWRDIGLRTWEQIGHDNVGLVAAGVAFYGLLGVFPAIAALVSVYGLIADPAEVQRQFEAASVAFSLYVRNFGSYNETYGSLGAVVGMMMWFWLSAFIVIMGAELNAETERQTRRDTTTGKPKPMGQRGAYAADTVGEKP